MRKRLISIWISMCIILPTHAYANVFDLDPFGATYGLDIYNSATGSVTHTGNLGFTTGTIAAYGTGTVFNLASFGASYGLDIFNSSTGIVTHTGDLGWTTGTIAVDGSGNVYNLASYGATYGLNIYNSKTGTVTNTGNLGWTTGTIAADGSGKVYNLASYGATYGLNIYDSKTGAVTSTGNLGWTTSAIAADGSGKVYNLASYGATYGLNIYNSKTGTVTSTGNLGWTSGAIAVDGSGKVYNLTSFGATYGLNIYDSKTGVMTQTNDLGFISGIFAANVTHWFSMLGSIQSLGNSAATGAATTLDSIIATSPSGDMATVVNALNALNSQTEVSNAISQTLPLLTGATSQVIKNELHDINRIINARQENATGLSTGDKFYGDKYFWFRPFGSWANQNDRNGVAGYSANTYGMMFGADKELNDTNRLGIALAHARSYADSNSSNAPQNSNISSYLALLYGNHSLSEATSINFQADMGKHDVTGSRSIIFMNRVANSNYSSWNGHIGMGIAHTISLSERTSFTPSLSADYTIIREDSYAESGADALNLIVNSSTTHEMIVGVDGKIAHAVTDQVYLNANFGLGYDALNSQTTITSAFAGDPAAAFITRGMELNPWIAHGGLGCVTKPNDMVDISARYNFEVRNGFNNQTASVNIRWAF